MKKLAILLLCPILFLLPSCDLNFTDGTILDEFVKQDEERKATGISVSAAGTVSMIYDLEDGYTLSGVKTLLMYDDGSSVDVSGEVTYTGLPFSSVGENTVEVGYGEYVEPLVVDYSSYTVQIAPRGMDTDFFIPDEFGQSNAGSVFVGWAAEGTDEVLSFPLLNESYDAPMVIHPVFKPVSEVFVMDGTTAAGVLEPYYEFYGIPASVTALGDNLFYRNDTVKAVAFESGSALSSIGSFAFYSSSLEYIGLPPSLTEIKDSAFSMVSNLKKLVWEDEPGIRTIGRNSFTGYPLEVFEIPSSVESIERSIIGPSPVKKIVFLEGSGIASVDQYAFDYTYDVEIIFVKPLFETLPEYASSCWGSYMSTVRVER